ncbi:ribosomal-processing cysteine protease Prp [Alkalicoccobacillus porphyridii]|uniref:Ribosomal processing cysteine protease Prp n=1 Tax=Alkalicoccobacillus porphyridii TaxID=2597270 RepID=A0A553ZXN6_9BACI|nr:ribosomal-processing cysteine protease Prp [Alkalicoccobacillus porphyridii]TSB46203.1 ribosomal-processing cysteine protease Prp [Alkalicoccobacillus porphyridii]
MIEVRINRHPSGRIQSFSMSGHAESGPYGHDLVCAGASAVSIGAVNAAQVLCQAELLVETQQDGGYISCTVPEALSESQHRDVQLLLEGMVLSLKSIEEEYDAFISITDRR